jgi:hypothetical protein
MSELARESLVAQKIGTGDYQYTITLKDTGTTTIGTFWFAWIPSEDFMPVRPLSVALPAGWRDNITHAGSHDGFAIQWIASSPSSELHPGQSKVFHFRSSATPAQVFGKSTFYPTQLVTTSFVYSGMPFSDLGYEFHSSSNTVIPPAPAALADRGGFTTVDALGVSTSELLGLNDHGIGDALGGTQGLLAAPAAAEAVSGLAGILASSMPAVSSAEAFSGDFAFHGAANIGGMSRSGPALDLGTVSANAGWGWHGSS